MLIWKNGKAHFQEAVETDKTQKMLTMRYLLVSCVKFFNPPKVKRHMWRTTSNEVKCFTVLIWPPA